MSGVHNGGELRQRDPRVRDKPYLAWLSTLPCIACAVRGRRRFGVHCAHVKVGFPEAGWRAFGHSEKSHDRHAVPLCPADHMHGSMAQHRNPWGDERAWWAALGVYPPDFCAALSVAFDRGDSGGQVVEDFAERARRACAGAGEPV